MTASGRYEVLIKASAEREMNALPRATFKRITRAVDVVAVGHRKDVYR